MKKGKVIAVILLFIAFFCYLMFGTNIKQTDDVSYYQALAGESGEEKTLKILGASCYVYCPYDLPWLSEMGAYTDCRFDYTAKRCGIFNSSAYSLILSYDEAEYSAVKEQLEARYTYRTENIAGEDGPAVSPDFVMDGFSFRSVDGGDYPKEMFFIGVCDERAEVALIYFYDQDLDYISPSLTQFLQEESGWCNLQADGK